jgi:PAS domain S-box-containing protein
MAVIKAQNQAVRRSRLGRVLEDFPYPATVANAHNLLVYVNPAFTGFYGWHEKEVLGLTPRFLVDRAFPEKELIRIKREITEAPTQWCGQVENVTKSRKRLLVRLWAIRVRPDPKLPCLYYLGLTVPVASNARPEEEFTSRLAGSLLAERNDEHPGTERLSRSQQIGNFRALGYSTKDIAQILGVAPNSINVALHRERRRVDKVSGDANGAGR